MRRPAAALLASMLLLAACGGNGAEPTPDDDAAVLGAVQIEGAPGSEPSLTFDQPLEVNAPISRVESEGDGAAVEDGQVIQIHYIAVNGEDGSLLGSTWEGQPQRMMIGGQLPELENTLAGQAIGSRVLYAEPGGIAPEQGQEFPAVIMAIDIVDAYTMPERAEGTAVEPPEGLPTVTLADDGVPTIDVEGVEPPTELIIQPLIEGDGPEVEVGQTVTIHYRGVLLADGEDFDSSWDRGVPATFPIGVGQLIEGWDVGLPGQTVGSQVLLVIPAEQAYGADDRPGIPANSDLVFVVDILDAG